MARHRSCSSAALHSDAPIRRRSPLDDADRIAVLWAYIFSCQALPICRFTQRRTARFCIGDDPLFLHILVSARRSVEVEERERA